MSKMQAASDSIRALNDSAGIAAKRIDAIAQRRADAAGDAYGSMSPIHLARHHMGQAQHHMTQHYDGSGRKTSNHSIAAEHHMAAAHHFMAAHHAFESNAAGAKSREGHNAAVDHYEAGADHAYHAKKSAAAAAEEIK